MNKKIVAIMIGVVALFATAACNSDKGDTERKTTVTTFNKQKASLCLEATQNINKGIGAISVGLDAMLTADRESSLEFLATAREFVSTSIESVKLCADLTPVESAAFLKSLYELRNAIDTLSNAL